MSDSAAVPGTDRKVMRTAAYVDSGKLDDRRNIYAYRWPKFDLVESVLDHLSVPRSGRVLDVGCGPGTYSATLRARDASLEVTGVDLSAGMLTTARNAGVKAVAVTDATQCRSATRRSTVPWPITCCITWRASTRLSQTCAECCVPVVCCWR